MSCDHNAILFIFLTVLKLTYSCSTIWFNNVTFGHIENFYFNSEQIQSHNISCSWIINSSSSTFGSYFIFSLRILDVDDIKTSISNELLLKTDDTEILINDINQRVYYIPSSNVKIYYQSKNNSHNLNIRRFLIEFIHVDNSINKNDYFQCSKTGLIIPKQWKCNCLHECLANDDSDEENCSLCSSIKSSNNLVCQSNESWCLPIKYSSNAFDLKGICLRNDENIQCLYKSKCERTIAVYQDKGDILIDNNLLSNFQSICFVIIAKEKHHVKLFLNKHDNIGQFENLKLLIYDGTEEQNKLLFSSLDWFSMTRTIQTVVHPIATIRFERDVQQYLQEYNEFNMILNITYISSICREDEMLCGGRFETKCYSKSQRCDGIWDCITGDDELGCVSSCPTSFVCSESLHRPMSQHRCYPLYERCNGNVFCPNRSDERNCTNVLCNSNNGTFLCRNGNCIYEAWACDGTDDCDDNSDESNCPVRLPRRIVTAAIIGGTICSTLFIIALGCTCKLFHLRSAERHVSTRLLNPFEYIEQRRAEYQQYLNQQRTSEIDDPSSNASDDARRIAPPSYSQTMGFSNDNEERHALLAEHLRLAGLSHFIPMPFSQESSRTTNHRHRRRRRHRRCHRRSQNNGQCDPLLESTDSTSSRDHLIRFRSQFRSLFHSHLPINNNVIPSNELDTYVTRPTVQPNESLELPPPYSEEQLLTFEREHNMQSSIPTSVNTSSRLIHMRKQYIPRHTIPDDFDDQPLSSLIAGSTHRGDDQESSDDDDKMLMP